jgi:hypothetical protein
MAAAPNPLPQMGGMHVTLAQETSERIGALLLVGLVLVCVYVSRVPESVLSFFESKVGQVVGLFAVLGITASYGWVHGILAALAYALVVSRAIRFSKEGFLTYAPAVVLPAQNDTTIVPEQHRWFVEKVLGENPFLIREKEVKTAAVQDDSERGMGSSAASFSR